MMNIKNEKLLIEGNRVYLRTLTESDATERYCSWLNDQTVNKYLETRSATIESLKKYIKEKNENPDCLFLGIFLKNTAEHIGNIKLEPIELGKKRAVLGLLIGDKRMWGKGFGTEVVKILVDWTFENIEINEIELGVITENQAAVKVYEKAGFKVNRIEKDKIKHDDIYYDIYHMIAKR